ncbi:MAG: hypothetical protein ACRCU2_13095 [Planktothrix sp.]
MNETIESRERYWELELMRRSGFPPDLIPQIAYILAQDDIEGFDNRSAAQTEFMRKALVIYKGIKNRQKFTN